MRHRALPWLISLIVACLPSAARADLGRDIYQHDQSEAWHAETGQFLYRESHWLWWRGQQLLERRVQYRCRSGEVFAEKIVDYRAEPLAPDFRLQDTRSGYEEGLRSEAGQRIVFVRRKRGESMNEAPLPAAEVDQTLVADAGFDLFLTQRWQRLQQGETLYMSFLVPSALKPIDFKVRPITEADPTLLTARLSLGAWWGFLAPHIDATYRRTDGRLLQYVGLSNLRDPEGDNYPVRIRFAPVPQDIDAAAYAAAGKAARVNACPGDMRAISPR